MLTKLTKLGRVNFLFFASLLSCTRKNKEMPFRLDSLSHQNTRTCPASFGLQNAGQSDLSPFCRITCLFAPAVGIVTQNISTCTSRNVATKYYSILYSEIRLKWQLCEIYVTLSRGRPRAGSGLGRKNFGPSSKGGRSKNLYAKSERMVKRVR